MERFKKQFRPVSGTEIQYQLCVHTLLCYTSYISVKYKNDYYMKDNYGSGDISLSPMMTRARKLVKNAIPENFNKVKS